DDTDIEKPVHKPGDAERSGHARQHQLGQRPDSHGNHPENTFAGLEKHDAPTVFTNAVRRKSRPRKSTKHGLRGFPQAYLLDRPAEEPPFHHLQRPNRKSTRLNSSHVKISYAVFCLK